MGVKYFNRYLLDTCSTKAIRRMSFHFLIGKRIVIDTSIFLYRFKKQNALLEKMFLFISLLRRYGVEPLFVFDGKPAEEKRKLLIERFVKKKEANEKLQVLKSKMNNIERIVNGDVSEEYTNIKTRITQLEKESTRITYEDLNNVKNLMDYYRTPYVTAIGEADQLCAYLVNHDYAWACMSDDMDMFIYNCKRVLRDPNIINHDVLLYDTEVIMEELNIKKEVLTCLLVLLGTDYFVQKLDFTRQHIKSFDDALKLYQEYSTDTVAQISHIWFYPWLSQNSYINNERENELWEVHRIFGTQYNNVKNDLNENETNDSSHLWKVTKNKVSMDLLKKLLIEKEGFIFT
jgi:hypothetical protein